MKFVRPRVLDEVLVACADMPGSILLAGGTDVMVDVNEGRLRPSSVIDLSQVEALKVMDVGRERIRLGAGVTFARISDELGGVLPALATAARTVGSPQIRHRGTVGGNIGTASPAGDILPVIVAMNGDIELWSVRGKRLVAARDYFHGPRRTSREPDECIVAVHLPRATHATQHFLKVGPRNAMVIAVASFCLHVDPQAEVVGTGLGSVGPRPLYSGAAEQILASALFDGQSRPSPDVAEAYAEAVAETTTPIDDVRATAAYRRHIVRILAQRALKWAIEDLETP